MINWAILLALFPFSFPFQISFHCFFAERDTLSFLLALRVSAQSPLVDKTDAIRAKSVGSGRIDEVYSVRSCDNWASPGLWGKDGLNDLSGVAMTGDVTAYSQQMVRQMSPLVGPLVGNICVEEVYRVENGVKKGRCPEASVAGQEPDTIPLQMAVPNKNHVD